MLDTVESEIKRHYYGGSGKGPVLARGAELAGIKMKAEEAGHIFPFAWSTRSDPGN
jgi:hypothetical protein